VGKKKTKKTRVKEKGGDKLKKRHRSKSEGGAPSSMTIVPGNVEIQERKGKKKWGVRVWPTVKNEERKTPLRPL